MDNSGAGKSPNTSLSFRYNANNEELEELCGICDDDPPTPQCDVSKSESASPKRVEKTSSILDKYFKSIRAVEKIEDLKAGEPKATEESRSPPKDVSSSPMKEYLKSFGKRNNSEGTPEPKEGGNETWRIFHDFKYKITQAVEDMKTRSSEDAKDKVVRDNSVSDSEENSAIKDSDISVGDTDNQVSSLNSSLHNLSELTQPLTAKPNEVSPVKDHSEGSDDTHKNLIHSGPADITKFDFNTEVESGVEAFEDVFNNMEESNKDNLNTPKHLFDVPESPPLAPNITLPPLLKESLLEKPTNVTNTNDIHFVSYTMCLLTLFLCVNYCLLPTWSSWNSFIFGLWAFCIASNSKRWVIESFFSESESQTCSLPRKESASLPMYTIPSVKEHRPIKKFEGWINHYRSHNYDPFTYNINKTTTAFIKLDGPCLRLSYTSTKIPKRALWDEKLEPAGFYQHRLYSLVGARIMLLPKGLVRRRQWSKKYPICITLSEDEKIQVLEKEGIGSSVASDKKKPETPEPRREPASPGMESAETNTSPEKRKKFIWRRRDKSVTHAEIEGSKEGLRHRLGRKKNRDKKTDVASSTEGNGGADKPAEETPSEPEVAQGSALAFDILDLDDTDANVKEFLEDTEVEQMADNAMEGEWSLHVKQSRGRHSHLYLFARTGREKHEWYRRFLLSISEANHVSPAEPEEPLEGASGAGPGPGAGTGAGPDRDSIEMAVFHAHEDKEGVSLYSGTMPSAQSSPSRPQDSAQSVSEEPPLHGLYRDYLTHEKYFWPYFLKIIEAGRAGVSCECRSLPAEVSWLNTALARVFYDVMRDAALAQRLQARIQRKLHTLKLPAFMSPLVVTQLSLLGACPLVARVASPAWDERGLWLDADLRYAGGAYITILTQINLMKLKEKNITLEEQLLDAEVDSAESLRGRGHTGLPFERFLRPDCSGQSKSKPAVFDSDMEDSAESSDDDETPPLQPVDSAETVHGHDSPPPEPAAAPGSSKKKFLRMVDKIATNKYFQQVTDYKYVKRAMEGLSNTDIKLQLEVQGLDGRLAINIPPPPHDRIWIGFRTNPQLVLKARPTVGARTLRFAHISNWIEQKLTKEFEKVLVIPNMEDIVVDCLSPTPIDFDIT